MISTTTTTNTHEDEALEETLLTATALSKRWSLSAGSLANVRSQGKGVTYLKIGQLVRYRLSDVVAYETAGVVRPIMADAA